MILNKNLTNIKVSLLPLQPPNKSPYTTTQVNLQSSFPQNYTSKIPLVSCSKENCIPECVLSSEICSTLYNNLMHEICERGSAFMAPTALQPPWPHPLIGQSGLISILAPHFIGLASLQQFYSSVKLYISNINKFYNYSFT